MCHDVTPSGKKLSEGGSYVAGRRTSAMPENGESAGDRIGRRGTGSWVREWVLLEGGRHRLADARFGSFDVVAAVLEDYSLHIVGARRLRVRVEDDAADGALADLVEVLELFGPAREHFRTLYFQWALINLSRAVLYAAVPALVVSIAMILFADTPGALPGTVLGVDALLLAVVTAATVGLSPFAILLSYILRIGTAAKRTLAIGPFALSESDDGPVN
jgi:hypothetical protein